MQLPLAALTALENLVNPLLRQVVAQAGATAANLDELQDSCLEIRIAPWGLQVFLLVTPDGLYFHRTLETEPDAWVEATPQAYLKMATQPAASGVLFTPEVKVGGDTRKLELLQDLIASLGLDTGDLVARFSGPLPLAGLQAGFTQLRSWGSRASAAARRDLKDYLEEESGILPGQNSLHLLESGLEELRLDVDRLEARIRLLEAARKQAGET
ncbi:SCP2 domain-containing protein [Marinospirillum sp.]|uniref:ubiquinone biosynthesis accessory factor UbiJ n=1 Tax=Marinospirillum sp. TaxID=2183934 RepID=UPI00384C67AF